MPAPEPRPDPLQRSRHRLLRGLLIAAPVSLALWAALGVSALHALPDHSRHALAWRLHHAVHLVGNIGNRLV